MNERLRRGTEPGRRQTVRRLIARVAAFMACALPALALAGELLEALGAGDTIRITVFQNPDLTTEARISEQGTVVFPLLGELGVAGRTPAEAGALIAEQLRQGRLLKNPQVSVAVVQLRSRQVSVLGSVARPGRYTLDGTSSHVTDILALAGGIDRNGADGVIVIGTRNGRPARIEVNVPAIYRKGDLSNNIELQGGDIVFAPPAPVFYIYGEVQRPGAYRLDPGMAVINALSLGGGLTARGTARGLKIHRRAGDGSLTEVDATLTRAIEPNDVIYVRESLF